MLATVIRIGYDEAMQPPECHTPCDLSAVEWAADMPGREVAASFLGSFGVCPLDCQDRGRDLAAADVDATILVVFGLISTSIALQGAQAVEMLVNGASTVSPLVRSVLRTVLKDDFAGARTPVRDQLMKASVAERSALIEWWSNTAAARPGQLRTMMQAFGLG